MRISTVLLLLFSAILIAIFHSTKLGLYGFGGFILYIIFLTVKLFLNSDSKNSYMELDVDGGSTNSARNRKNALRNASKFLSPYSDPTKNLRLTNEYIVVTLGSDGETIKCRERRGRQRAFKICYSEIYDQNDLWDFICWFFNEDKTYDDFVEDLKVCKAKIQQEGFYQESETPMINKVQIQETKIAEIIDINNCDESAIKNLPGINIVIAKKIINKRNELGGFKNVDEFIQFIKPTSSIESQLRERIKTGEYKVIKKEFNSERQVDI